MRHQKVHHKLNRTSTHRMALMRNMATALFRHERIETTHAKARALKSFADRLITLGKRGDLHARRRAAVHIKDHEILRKLFDELAERYRAREGGYTRVLKVNRRRGDNAPISLIELVDAKLKMPEGEDEGDEATS
ncbi:50S ribosomal protein L17 [Myxococcota bacterium]